MAVATPRRVVAEVSAEGDAAGSGERSLVETALKLAFQSDYEGVCSTLLDLVETTFAAGASWVLLHDARTNCLVTAAYRGRERRPTRTCAFRLASALWDWHSQVANQCLCRMSRRRIGGLIRTVCITQASPRC